MGSSWAQSELESESDLVRLNRIRYVPMTGCQVHSEEEVWDGPGNQTMGPGLHQWGTWPGVSLATTQLDCRSSWGQTWESRLKNRSYKKVGTTWLRPPSRTVCGGEEPTSALLQYCPWALAAGAPGRGYLSRPLRFDALIFRRNLVYLYLKWFLTGRVEKLIFFIFLSQNNWCVMLHYVMSYGEMQSDILYPKGVWTYHVRNWKKGYILSYSVCLSSYLLLLF